METSLSALTKLQKSYKYVGNNPNCEIKDERQTESCSYYKKVVSVTCVILEKSGAGLVVSCYWSGQDSKLCDWSGELRLRVGQEHGRELHRALGEQDNLLHRQCVRSGDLDLDTEIK